MAKSRPIETHMKVPNDRQPPVTAVGNVGLGGAEQSYEICYADEDGLDTFVNLDFVSLEQPGVTNEALLAIVIDRLEGFQSGKFACIENQIALDHCRAALATLGHRTALRTRRGVEGTVNP